MIPGRTILVDVGNSAAKVAERSADGVRDGNADSVAAGLPFCRIDLRDSGWAATVVESQRARGPHTKADAAQSLRWVVASVNRPASDALRERVASEWPDDEWFELGHGDVPLPSELRNPTTVGIDRLLGAAAAWRLGALLAGQPEPESARELPPVISIDAGSAVTVDLIRQGVFIGGAILPGLRLQLASLTQGTDRLPAVHHRPVRPLEVPGRDTESAMQTGVMLGLAGGIDRLLERYSDSSPIPPRVFLTGGDAAAIEPLLSHAVVRRDDLVLSAIADAAAALGYHGASIHSR